MARLLYLSLGMICLVLGAVGMLVPVLPTVPFAILAAFLFARSSPALERRLLEHPTLGPHIVAWRNKRAISRRGKVAAGAAFAISAATGILLAPWPFSLFPLAAALAGASWVLSRPTA